MFPLAEHIWAIDPFSIENLSDFIFGFWRKMMLPKMSFLDSFDEFDGGVYEARNRHRWTNAEMLLSVSFAPE